MGQWAKAEWATNHWAVNQWNFIDTSYAPPSSTLTGPEYLSIATIIADACLKQLSVISDFFNALEVVLFYDHIQVKLDLLAVFDQAYLRTNNAMTSTGPFNAIVTSVQNQVLRNSGEPSISAFIQKYIIDAGYASGIPEQWAMLSKSLGHDIDDVIDPETIISSSSTSSDL